MNRRHIRPFRRLTRSSVQAATCLISGLKLGLMTLYLFLGIANIVVLAWALIGLCHESALLGAADATATG